MRSKGVRNVDRNQLTTDDVREHMDMCPSTRQLHGRVLASNVAKLLGNRNNPELSSHLASDS